MSCPVITFLPHFFGPFSLSFFFDQVITGAWWGLLWTDSYPGESKTKKPLSCLVKHPRTVLIVSEGWTLAGQTPKVSSNYPQSTLALLSHPNKNILPQIIWEGIQTKIIPNSWHINFEIPPTHKARRRCALFCSCSSLQQLPVGSGHKSQLSNTRAPQA